MWPISLITAWWRRRRWEREWARLADDVWAVVPIKYFAPKDDYNVN